MSTADECRSPIAAARLRAAMPGRADLDVQTAGFRTEGRPADRRAQEHAKSYGANLQAHRTRVVDRDLLAEADLIIALAGQHLREVAAFDRRLLTRTFTLKDLVRRSAAMPIGAGEPVSEWLERMAAGRTRGDLLAEGAASDVLDPADASKRVFGRVAAEIDDLVDRLAPAIAGALTHPIAPEAHASEATADGTGMTATEPVRARPRAPDGVDSALVALVGDASGAGLVELIREYLLKSGHVLVDLTAVQEALPADAHPAEAVAFAVAAGDAALGVCVCPTGNASAIAANRIDGVIAAVAHDVTSARLARRTLGANVLCLGARLVSASTVFDAVSAFLASAPRQPA